MADIMTVLQKSAIASIAEHGKRASEFGDRETASQILVALALIEALRKQVSELESQPADQFTAELVELDGHTYGLRPGAARIVREALSDAGRAAMLESMLACEREKVTNAAHLLTGIHSLLYPAHITAEDGRVWAFRPRSVDPHEVLQELSDRIRELPEKIAAMAKDTTSHDEECVNCGCSLPIGCDGVFAHQSECMLNNAAMAKGGA